jgi:phage terminase small subunit
VTHEKELESKLTAKQRAFISEYLKDFNATQAAIRAGYAESGARQEGHRLLTNADIRQDIDRHFQDLGLTGERLLAEQIAMAFADFGDYVQIDEGGRRPSQGVPFFATRENQGH